MSILGGVLRVQVGGLLFGGGAESELRDEVSG